MSFYIPRKIQYRFILVLALLVLYVCGICFLRSIAKPIPNGNIHRDLPIESLLQNETDAYPEISDESLQRAKILLSDVDKLVEKYGKDVYKVGKRNFTPKPPLATMRRKIYYQHYLKLFGENNEEKMNQLNAFRFGIGEHSLCYMNAYATFLKYCHYAYYERGGMKPIRKLIANACDAKWLNLDKINDIFQRTCQWKFQYILQR